MPISKETRQARHEHADAPRTKRGQPHPKSGNVGDQAFTQVSGKGLVHFVKGDQGWKEMSSSTGDFSGGKPVSTIIKGAAAAGTGGGTGAGTGITSVQDSAATPGLGGQHGNLPSGHVNLILDGGVGQDTATLYNVASANSNLTIEDDEDGNGNAFLKFTAADQSVSLHRFDAIYAEDEENVTTTYANASGSNGIVFQDTEETTWTIGALTNSKIDVSLDITFPTMYTHPTSAGNKHIPTGGSANQFLKYSSSGTAVWATHSYTTNTNTQNTYTSSWVDSSADVLLRLTGGGATSGDQDIKMVAGNNVSLTPSGANMTISSVNTTSVDSTNAQTGAFYSLVEDGDTIKALKTGTGIAMTTDSGSAGDVITISSTVNTSGLLTNGIVTIEDSSDDTQNASGGDILKFAEDSTSTIGWAVTMSSNTITITPELSGYNNGNWNTAYTHSQATHAPTNAEQNVQSDWNSGSGDAHILNKPSIPTRTSLGIDSDDAVTFGALTCPTVNTGQGAYELYKMDQDVDSESAVVFTTVNTGQGATEVHMMNQNIRTTDDVTFNDFRADSIGIGTAASGTTGEIRATNEVTAYYSDDRLKNRYGNIEDALKKVCSLSGFHYQPNEVAGSLGYDTSQKKVGVSAQEVLKVLPEAVTEAPIDPQYHAVQYDKLVPLLIEAVKELSERKCNCGV